MDDYKNKPSPYFDNVRSEISTLLPAEVERVLDIGCGAGATLHWLKQTGRCQWTAGIEMMEGPAALARQRADDVVVGDANLLVESAFTPQSLTWCCASTCWSTLSTLGHLSPRCGAC